MNGGIECGGYAYRTRLRSDWLLGGGGGVMYVGWSLGSLENQPPMFEMEPSGGR